MRSCLGRPAHALFASLCALAPLGAQELGVQDLGVQAPRAPRDALGRVDFDRDVRPILSNHCFACHGPDERRREAELRLDLRNEAMRVITPGDGVGSELVLRVTHTDEAERMPPTSLNKPLDERLGRNRPTGA